MFNGEFSIIPSSVTFRIDLEKLRAKLYSFLSITGKKFCLIKKKKWKDVWIKNQMSKRKGIHFMAVIGEELRLEGPELLSFGRRSFFVFWFRGFARTSVHFLSGEPAVGVRVYGLD